MGDKTSVNIGISIPQEMFKWLEKPDNKKRINRSQLFQGAVNKIRNPDSKKITPMSYLVIIFGMTFGVGLLAASASAVFEFVMSATCFMLGGVILMAALVTLIKESRYTLHKV